MSKQPKPTLPPHLPVVDLTVPADQSGRPYCTCGIPIVDGDVRHTLPDAPPEQAAHARRYEPTEGD